jgi:hypothetical protein
VNGSSRGDGALQHRQRDGSLHCLLRVLHGGGVTGRSSSGKWDEGAIAPASTPAPGAAVMGSTPQALVDEQTYSGVWV